MRYALLMTGYEKSPDYGYPPPGKNGRVLIAIAIVIVAGMVFWRLI